MKLILGSQSPRRRELLERMGLRFQVLTAEIDETKYKTQDPESSVRRICEAKARAVAEKIMQKAECKMQNDGSEPGSGPQSAPLDALILTADTIVVLEGKIMGKPRDRAEARAMLTALSGREHQVFTAFTILPYKAFSPGGRCPSEHTGADEGSASQEAAPYTHCEMTHVKFRALSGAEIAAYVATGEPMDKAGAYGIQNLGAMLVESIRGDYFTVMGLPVCRLAQALKGFGLDPLLGQEMEA